MSCTSKVADGTSGNSTVSSKSQCNGANNDTKYVGESSANSNQKLSYAQKLVEKNME